MARRLAAAKRTPAGVFARPGSARADSEPAQPTQLVVAATAPFGADVLERLAGRHEVAALLTRPDRPAGRRGRRLAAPAREAGGRTVRHPGAAAGAADRRARAAGRDGRRRRLWPPHPRVAARARALAQRPSLAPAALARRGARRAGAAHGDTETGVTIHETVTPHRSGRHRRATQQRVRRCSQPPSSSPAGDTAGWSRRACRS